MFYPVHFNLMEASPGGYTSRFSRNFSIKSGSFEASPDGKISLGRAAEEGHIKVDAQHQDVSGYQGFFQIQNGNLVYHHLGRNPARLHALNGISVTLQKGQEHVLGPISDLDHRLEFGNTVQQTTKTRMVGGSTASVPHFQLRIQPFLS